MIAKYLVSLMFVSLTSHSALAAIGDSSPLKIVQNSGKTVSINDNVFLEVRADEEELPSEAQYEIRRIDGKLVQSGDLNGSKVDIKASTLGKGVYFMKVSAANPESAEDSVASEFYRFQVTN